MAPTRGDEDVPEGEAASVVVDDLADAQREAVPPQEDGQREGGLALDDSLRWREGSDVAKRTGKASLFDHIKCLNKKLFNNTS